MIITTRTLARRSEILPSSPRPSLPGVGASHSAWLVVYISYLESLA